MGTLVTLTPAGHLPTEGEGTTDYGPSAPRQCSGPLACPQSTPKKPPARKQGSCPLALPSLTTLCHPRWENPQEPNGPNYQEEPNGPNCQALGCHGNRGWPGTGRGPTTQPAPLPSEGRCSLFVLCSMLGGGQQRRRGCFHICMEIQEPLGQGWGSKRGWVGKPSFLQAG